MARFLVLVKTLIGGRLVDAGDIVELDPNLSFAGANLRPLDPEAADMRAKSDQRTAETAPPGSASANELRRMMTAAGPVTEAAVQPCTTDPRS